jgi:SWI/SNF-related matrix-associated actin-dependent regulator of chromatin subfamily A containing DEAD/H box 1
VIALERLVIHRHGVSRSAVSSQAAVPVWQALIVDEAHSLKNPSTRRFQRVADIEAEFRLLLTGTPVQNNIEEVLCLLRFVASDLFSASIEGHADAEDAVASEHERWAAVVEAFVAETAAGAPGGEEDSMVRSVCSLLEPFILHRTKLSARLALPPKTLHVVTPEMRPFQQAVYTSIQTALRVARERGDAPEASSDELSQALDGSSTSGAEATCFVGGVTSHVGRAPITGPLMLVRRAANHPLLLRCAYPDTFVLGLARALHSLQLEEAPIAKRSKLVTDKSHDLWGDMELRFAESGMVRGEDGCTKYVLHPAASQPFIPLSLAELTVWADGDRLLARVAQQLMGMSDFEISEHVCAMDERLSRYRLEPAAVCEAGKVQRLLVLLREEKGKFLVFSQFNIVLDILERVLSLHGTGWLRLDGSTAPAERQALCDQFRDHSELRVFLLTTRAGGLGLNLTTATNVVIFDCDWNPQVDRQAEDRAHRMGQTKAVMVTRMASKDTIEERILHIASDKRELERTLLPSAAPATTGENG